jgi:hypothetical protein
MWMDEGFHYLAAQGILKHGYPLYPSGHIYWKAVLYAYALAAGSLVFGFKVVTLRVLSVFCVAGMIGLAYHVGRRYFSRTIGALAAGILAFSIWELEYARLALYFAPLQLFYILGLYFFYRGFFEEDKRFKAPAIVIFLIIPFIHQLGMGVVFAFPALFLMQGARRFFRKDVLRSFILTVVFYLGVQIQEYFFWKVGYVYEKTDMTLRGAIGYFFGNFKLDFFKEFFRSYPWMSLAVLAGFFLCLGGILRRDEGEAASSEPESARSPWLYFNLCLLLPLIFWAFFRTRIQPRYLFQLFPVFVFLFLLGIQAFSRVFVQGLAAPALGLKKPKTRAILAGIVFFGLVLAMVEGSRPGQLMSVVNRRYGDPITTDIINRSGRFEHYDHESVGLYTRRNLRPDDLVIAIHVVFQKAYIGQVDYWLWSGGPGTWDAWEKTADGRWQDYYVGARWLNNLADLRKVVEENPGRRVWLVTSPSLLRADHVNREIHDYIAVQNADKIAFRGKDGMSEVYVWNAPELTAGGRRALEGEWLPALRGEIVKGAEMSGGEAIAWSGMARRADEFPAKIAGEFPAGAYRTMIRYRTGPGYSEAKAARFSVVDGRGGHLRTIALTEASRPADAAGWRTAEAGFSLIREGNLRILALIPAGCDLMIDYIDIRPKEGER